MQYERVDRQVTDPWDFLVVGEDGDVREGPVNALGGLLSGPVQKVTWVFRRARRW
jgi:hypothetical protein